MSYSSRSYQHSNDNHSNNHSDNNKESNSDSSNGNQHKACQVRAEHFFACQADVVKSYWCYVPVLLMHLHQIGAIVHLAGALLSLPNAVANVADAGLQCADGTNILHVCNDHIPPQDMSDTVHVHKIICDHTVRA